MTYDKNCRREGAFFGSTLREKMAYGVPLYLDLRRGECIRLPYGHIEDDPRIEHRTKGRFRKRILEKITPGARVLELGCGPGGLSLEMARLGAVVDAHDISEECIRIARKYAQAQDLWGEVRYHHSDVNLLTLPRDTYDLVVCWEALHHFAEIEHVIGQIHKSLKPGAVFAFFEHVDLGRAGKAVLSMLYPWLPRHIIPAPHSVRWRKLMHKVSGGMVSAPQNVPSPVEPPFEDVSVHKVLPVARQIFPSLQVEETLCFSALLLGRMRDGSFKYPLVSVLHAFDNALISLGCKGQFAYGEVKREI